MTIYGFSKTGYGSKLQMVQKQSHLGTINIILYIDGDLAEPLLARALVTCTEAKTAALQELQAGSHYSMGIATGSGTDQTIVVANSESPYYYDSDRQAFQIG